MKPTTEWQARVWGFTGRMTPNESTRAIRDPRGDTIAPPEEKHPSVILRKPRRWVKMFQAQFVPKVQDGTKTTTIRTSSPGGNPQPGDTLDARYWTAKPYRSKQASILTAKITKVSHVEIRADGMIFREQNGTVIVAPNDGARGVNLDLIAIRDGFANWWDMVGWFQSAHGLPFTGIMIEWEVAS